jgi:DNA recombination protein RmuC
MTTPVAVLIGLGFVAAAVFAALYLARRTKGAGDTASGEGLQLVLQQINELSRTVDTKLGESAKNLSDSMRTQLSESTRIVKEVTEGLTKLDETNKQVVSFADQLKHLQDILQNPKQRGILGEYYLETVLQNVMPPGSFQMQYPFKNGEIVDAVVFVKDRIVPIDAKFSLENYNRVLEARDPATREAHEKAFKQDLKNRIDETSKYVRPAENTMEFAFMFIPSEGIYYDLLINQVGTVKTSTRDLIDYAFGKKVIIVSPTSFLAYLQTVLQGLRSLQIEEQAKDIQKRVGELGRHLGNYNEYMLKLGNALGTTVNHYNAASKELGKIDKDVVRIAGSSGNIEAMTLERPAVE